MAERIDITRMEQGTYGVEVTDGTTTTTHKVQVSPDLMNSVSDSETINLELEETLVRESFNFLLEREPADEILDEFKLTEISRYFPDYSTEIVTRIAQRS